MPGSSRALEDQAGTPAPVNRRVLVVDDNRAIHGDFRKVLGEPSHEQSALAELEAVLFGQAPARPRVEPFLIDSAYQGQEARALVEGALQRDRPYAVAFIDMRMPPGWDGAETAQRLWEIDPELQVVICTAYSDYSWEELLGRLADHSDRFLILKKPFDHIEVRQLATALSRKWTLARQARMRSQELEAVVRERTATIRDAHERLQREVTQRHRVEAQLRRAQKLEALGRLAAGIAHEINNPLAFVIANLQYVREAIELPPEKLAQAPLEELSTALAEACVGGDRIKQIVRDLKAFAQPHDESLAVVDVRPVLDFSLKMAAAEIRRRAQLVTRFDEVPAVWAISGRLEQVFVNLLVNAAQAIEPGAHEKNQISVVVRRAGGGEDVAIEISDTGVGIAAANLERIFDPFFTTKPVGVGTGLGLSICHSIVTAFGGDLTVESEEGKGSTFRVTLPSAARSEVDLVRAAAARAPEPARILVVDEPTVAKAIRRVLSTHKVQTADGGIAALAALEDRPFDLVLYDVTTRDLAPADLVRRLEGMGGDAVRRLALTAAGALPPELARLCAERGIPCLDKPFDAGEVDALLSRAP
jgi:signal transduction histidine kinase